MRQQSQSSDLLVNIWFKWRWKKVFRASGSVFCLVIIELHRRHDLDDVQRLVAQDRTGQFLAGDVTLAQQALAIRPIVAGERLRGGGGAPWRAAKARRGGRRAGP